MRSGDTVLGSIWWDRLRTSPEGTAIITMGGYNGTHTQEFFFLTSLFCLMVSIGNPVLSGLGGDSVMRQRASGNGIDIVGVLGRVSSVLLVLR